MDNINFLPENEQTEFESMRYLNPNLQVTRTNQFIDNLRANQQANNQQITMQARNLGTQVPSNLGGLTGGTGYFTSRYQTPQTNAATQNLRTAALLAAMNQAGKNELAMWQKRQQDAYRAYQKRQNDKTNTTTPSVGSGLEADVNEQPESVDISQYQGGEYKPETLYPVTNTKYDWQDSSGQWWQVDSPTFRDVTFGPAGEPLLYKPVNGNIVTKNGQQYVYLDSVPNQEPQWFPVTMSAGPQTYSPYVGGN